MWSCVLKVSYVIFIHISIVWHFQLNCKWHKFHLFDINSKSTEDELHHWLIPVWNFHFRIKCPSLTYLVGEWLIRHQSLLSNYLNLSTYQWISTAFQMNHECNLNYISCGTCEYGVSTNSWYIFCKKFVCALFSVEPRGVEHSHCNKPYSDVITKTITKTKNHFEVFIPIIYIFSHANIMQYSTILLNIPPCVRHCTCKTFTQPKCSMPLVLYYARCKLFVILIWKYCLINKTTICYVA